MVKPRLLRASQWRILRYAQNDKISYTIFNEQFYFYILHYLEIKVKSNQKTGVFLVFLMVIGLLRRLLLAMTEKLRFFGVPQNDKKKRRITPFLNKLLTMNSRQNLLSPT
jgi:hypothetical protein